VTISGEPGVGKSRLVREFGALLESQGAGTLWRQGHCLSYGKGIAFLALEEIVKAHTGILKTDNRTQATDKLDHAIQAAIEDDSETEWVKARLAALIGTGSLETTSSTDWGESFAAWASFFEAIASSRPLVIVFEDLHWADPALLDFVEYLAEWTTGVPMLILCTARGDLLESRTQWGGGLRNSTTLSLTPLGGDETNQLLHELLADQSLEEQFRSTLFQPPRTPPRRFPCRKRSRPSSPPASTPCLLRKKRFFMGPPSLERSFGRERLPSSVTWTEIQCAGI
jgi:predicted ATPase